MTGQFPLNRTAVSKPKGKLLLFKHIICARFTSSNEVEILCDLAVSVKFVTEDTLVKTVLLVLPPMCLLMVS